MPQCDCHCHYPDPRNFGQTPSYEPYRPAPATSSDTILKVVLGVGVAIIALFGARNWALPKVG